MATQNLILGDNMEWMKDKPDGYYGIGLVDPPFGIGADIAQNNNKGKNGYKLYKATNWDKRPTPEYWKEFLRVTKNKIISIIILKNDKYL